MTDADAGGARTTATLRTSHPRPAVVAAALAPDNTPQIDTAVAGDRVETTVRRAAVSGLLATTQDYLRNLDAADRTVRATLECLAEDADSRDDEQTRDRSERHATHTDSPTNEDTQTTDNE